MAVKITNGTGTMLEDVNAFYNVEAHNLGGFQVTGSLLGTGDRLDTARTIPFTAANAGNFTGCVISLFVYSVTHLVNPLTQITVELQEDVAGTWTTKATKVMTWGEITLITNTSSYAKFGGYFTVNFTGFDNVVAIDTTASKRRLSVIQNTVGGGPDRVYLMKGSDSTNYMYAVYCDTTSTFTSNVDTPIFAHYTAINSSPTFVGVLGTGDTVQPVCGIICSNTVSIDTDDICYLTYNEATSTEARTLTLKGFLIRNSHAGLRVGTATAPITTTKAFSIIAGTPAVGTSTISGIRGYANVGSSTFCYNGRYQTFLYGATVNNQSAFLTDNAAAGTKILTLDRDVSADWAAGNTVVIGKQNVQGQGVTTIHTISTVVGNVVTLTANLGSYDRLSGAVVMNLTDTRYGIRLNTATARNLYIEPGVSSNFVLKGFHAYRVYTSNANTVLHYLDDNPEAQIKSEVSNCVAYTDTTAPGQFLGSIYVTRSGFDSDDFCGFRTTTLSNLYSNTLSYMKPGQSNITNHYMVSRYNTLFSGASINGPVYFENIYIQNRYNSIGMYNYTRQGTFKNINLRGGANAANYVALTVSAINSYMENVNIDLCTPAIKLTGTNYNNKLVDVSLGVEATNVTDIGFTSPVFCSKVVFENCAYDTFDDVSYLDADTGSNMAFTEIGGTTNRDKYKQPEGTITRTGDGLPDTTVHTSGTGKFAIRFEPVFTGVPLTLGSDIPTGDITGKQMVVGVWCKINSANYYSGTYQMPRLTVHYDDGLYSAYAEAGQTTDRQYLFVPITPTTSFGQISVSFSADTDQISTDGYAYFDDFSTFYPPGVQLNLGGMDLFANAIPITPYIATNITAADVRAYPVTSLTTDGTIGKLIKKIYTFILSLL